MVAEHRRQEDLAQGVLGIVVTHGDLLEHDIPLDGDIAGVTHAVEDDIGNQIDGQFEILVKHMRVVAGVFLGGERVQFAADGVNRLRDLDRTAGRGGLEEQVLQEVRGAGNGRALIARTDVDPDADRRRTHRRHELGDDPETARQDGATQSRKLRGRRSSVLAPETRRLSYRRSRHRLARVRPPQRCPRPRGPARSCRGCRYRRSRPEACRRV